MRESHVLSLLGLLLLTLVAAVSIIVLIVGTSDDGGEEAAPQPATPTATPSPGGEPTASPSGAPVVDIEMVPTIQFDKDELTVGEGEVTVRANNMDDAILHNWAVYESREAAEGGEEAIAATEGCSAECQEEVTFNTPATGTYFFRCDFHPQQMTGTFIVR